MYKTIALTAMSVACLIQMLLYFASERRLRKHLQAPRNRHWEQEHELLKHDNKECASAMLMTFFFALLAVLTF